MVNKEDYLNAVATSETAFNCSQKMIDQLKSDLTKPKTYEDLRGKDGEIKNFLAEQ